MLLNEKPNSFQLGLDGFVWWLGVVESVVDPLNVGRVKVRIFGWHDSVISTNDLPWAFPMRPVTQSRSPSDVRCGDWAVGFFFDAGIGQQPIVMGVLPAIAQAPSSS